MRRDEKEFARFSNENEVSPRTKVELQAGYQFIVKGQGHNMTSRCRQGSSCSTLPLCGLVSIVLSVYKKFIDSILSDNN